MHKSLFFFFGLILFFFFFSSQRKSFVRSKNNRKTQREREERETRENNVKVSWFYVNGGFEFLLISLLPQETSNLPPLSTPFRSLSLLLLLPPRTLNFAPSDHRTDFTGSIRVSTVVIVSYGHSEKHQFNAGVSLSSYLCLVAYLLVR